jgi:hypothetical protein
MSDLEISYVNFKETPSNAATSAGNINHDLVYAMNLAASLDLKSGYIEPQITTETETTGVATSTRKSAKIPKSSSSEDKKWVIQTKWETPILDFQDISMSALKFDKSNSTLNPQVVQVTDSPDLEGCGISTAQYHLRKRACTCKLPTFQVIDL